MQRAMAFSVALLLLSSGAAALSNRGAASEDATPVSKVLTLLNGMVAKGQAEMHQEEVEYAEFKTFCDDQITQDQRAIKRETETIEGLTAEIQSEDAEATRLGKRVVADDADMNAAQSDIAKTQSDRQKAHADYEATHRDYSESIDALNRAIAVLKKQAYSRKQASFAQLKHLQQDLQSISLIPADAKKKLDLFLQQDEADDLSDDGLEISAPEANAYEFQGNQIIDMLSKLLDKFIDEKAALQKTEMNAAHAAQMLVADLNARIALDQKDRTSSSEDKGKQLHAKAADTDEKQQTSLIKQKDYDDLQNLQATCSQKASDFAARQQLRTEEIGALEKAIEILSSSAVKGNAEKYLPSALLQKKKASSLVQRKSAGTSPIQERVVQYLQQKADSINSRVLSALAVRVSEDPFTKVKKMIKDLVVRLMEEANEEADHKGWCDTELASNKQTREEKTSEVETLRAEIDEASASIQKLAESLGDLNSQVAETSKALKEATEMREGEKETNSQTIVDAKDAQAAVAQAMVVLKQFYEQAGEATAFLQQPYTGMQSENGGVVAMLEVIESDFARLEAETEAAESSATNEYDEFKTKTEMDMAVKRKTIEHKESNKQDREQALATMQNDLEGTQKEMDAAMSYYDKLKPSCVDAGVSYDDRVSRRKEEVESLQEALRIINGEDIA